MEKFNLQWNDFQSTVSNSFKIWRQEKSFFDVTLVADDHKQVLSHKVILSACSSFFKLILQNNDHSHPLIYLNGIDSRNLQFIIDYIYEGEVHLFQEQLDSFLDVACKLQIAGLESDHGKDMNNEFPANVKDQKNGEEAKEEYMETFEISKMNSENKPKRNTLKNMHIQRSTHENLRKIDDMLIQEADIIRCTICMKTSTNRTYMRRHVEIHMDGLSYECNLCKNTFRNKNLLCNHKQRAH